MGQNMFTPAGPAAQRLADAGWLVVIAFSAITVVMWALMLWLAVRRRGTLAEHAPWDAGGGMGWVTIGGILLPIVVFGGTLVLTLRTLAAFPMEGDHSQSGPPFVRVVGHQWWWELHYLEGGESERVVTANEIHIPTGRPIEIELRSADVIHSFWVPELHGKVDLFPDRVNHIQVQADRAQTLQGECAEFCGPQHALMRLLVKAETPDAFAAWLSHEREDASAPSTPEAERGRDIFMSHACVLCHTVRGTDARGMVGPDLTHMASRSRLASNAVANNEANLSAWVTHAQGTKPYAKMPNLTAFSGEELRDLVAYLRELK